MKVNNFSDDDAGTYDIIDTTLMMNIGRRSNVSKKPERKNKMDKDKISGKDAVQDYGAAISTRN